MPFSAQRFLRLTMLLALLEAPLAFGVVATEVDTFEDGTTGGWTVGGSMGAHPAPPQNVATGGPAGAGDNFLLLTSTGFGGPGSKLSAFNLSQWTGNFIAAGIAAIEMDVLNLGISYLSLRLLFADPAGGPPTNVALSTAAVPLPSGGGWTHVVFPISVSDLTTELGTAAGALSNATEMRLFHNPSAAFNGPPVGPPAITALLGIDNIAAVAGPTGVVAEPSMLALLASGLFAFLIVSGDLLQRRRAGFDRR
jgi:hypothetical protein